MIFVIVLGCASSSLLSLSTSQVEGGGFDPWVQHQIFALDGYSFVHNTFNKIPPALKDKKIIISFIQAVEFTITKL